MLFWTYRIWNVHKFKNNKYKSLKHEAYFNKFKPLTKTNQNLDHFVFFFPQNNRLLQIRDILSVDNKFIEIVNGGSQLVPSILPNLPVHLSINLCNDGYLSK